MPAVCPTCNMQAHLNNLRELQPKPGFHPTIARLAAVQKWPGGLPLGNGRTRKLLGVGDEEKISKNMGRSHPIPLTPDP